MNDDNAAPATISIHSSEEQSRRVLKHEKSCRYLIRGRCCSIHNARRDVIPAILRSLPRYRDVPLMFSGHTNAD
jgi:hypothetical protein